MNATELVTHLHRSGAHGYFWRSTDKRSRYYRVGDDPGPAQGLANIYFGVHPVNIQRLPNERGRIADVCGVNCLFSEFDAKHFGGSKDAIEAHLQARATLWPTVIVDSGGGLHCYWLLDQPHVISDDVDRKRIADLQARFVHAIGGDLGAKDLARVLRVPGTINTKYDPPRPVAIIEDWRANGIYTLEELHAWTYCMCEKFTPPDPQPSVIEPKRPQAPVENAGIAGILATLAAQREGNRNNVLFWASKRLSEKDIPHAHAETLLMPIADAIGLTDSETARTIASAYGGAA
jgi:putative DNA primase/helicase